MMMMIAVVSVANLVQIAGFEHGPFHIGEWCGMCFWLH